MIIKKLINKIIKKLLKELFYIFPDIWLKISRYSTTYNLEFALKKLINSGVEFKVIYDIGANVGDWSKLISRIIPKGKFYLFEGNVIHENELKKTGFSYHIGLLSSDKKIVNFYMDNTTGDSYYKEKTKHYDGVNSIELLTETLNDVVIKKSLPLPDLLKIDTQGSEIDILLGGDKSIKSSKAIYLECPIIEYNIGAPKFDEYINIMDKYGFVPFMLCENHYQADCLSQIDILFIKKDILKAINVSFEKIFY